MKTWLLKRLNTEAKQWPYHVNDRAKQRANIRRRLTDIRDAHEFEHSYVSVSVDGNVFTLNTRNASLSGFGEYYLETLRLAGVPIIDHRTVKDHTELARVVIHGPMVSHDGTINEGCGPLDYRPLREIAMVRKRLGATIHNLDI